MAVKKTFFFGSGNVLLASIYIGKRTSTTQILTTFSLDKSQILKYSVKENEEVAALMVEWSSQEILRYPTMTDGHTWPAESKQDEGSL